MAPADPLPRLGATVTNDNDGRQHAPPIETIPSQSFDDTPDAF
jgi:hypothetical protein